MAVEYKKVIAIKSFSINSDPYAKPPTPSAGFSIGQTYEIESTKAINFISSGHVIDYDTALSNAKCPPIIRTKAIRIG
ncbi:hypothetical protein [Bacillus sp. CD3-5]|uniref:hypothetical protein n=1 Tax=Bacillus sp. CD3-5 TaxID=2587157 RepID=UPI00111FCD1D|nr:hypothetical protein [Bacillus sp. CD3-5]TNP24160.1 hypothetical protein FH036_19180 [Bacillus sp. CD3-5]